jgi:hypothetical protein
MMESELSEGSHAGSTLSSGQHNRPPDDGESADGSRQGRKAVFGEQERQIIRGRVVACLNRVRERGGKLGRPQIARKVEEASDSSLAPVMASSG